MPKPSSGAPAAKARRACAVDPLESQLARDASEAAGAKPRSVTGSAAGHRRPRAGFAPPRGAARDDADGGGDGADDAGDGVAAATAAGLVPSKQSRRILEAARAQRLEDDEDDGGGGAKKRVRFDGGVAPAAAVVALAGRARADSGGSGAFTVADDDGEDEEIIEFEADDDVHLDGGYVDARGLDGGAAASAEDAAVLRRFMPDAPGDRRTLADIIMDKIKEKEGGGGGDADAGAGAAGPAPLDPRVVDVYTEVGRYLAHYKVGKIPKVFKVVPSLSNWEEVLFLTNPETWTPHATLAATRVFASNFNPAKAQRFFNVVLLPKCRDDISLHKRLNFHLYLALRKATYKPAAFYKGVVLPLAASGDCTLREALIFGSVIAKTGVPQLHSAAALIKLASLTPYHGATSIFLRVLVNKKYSLPYMAVDALVAHFLRFRDGVPGPLPIIWHQALLATAQRYKADLTREQKEGLKALLHVHAHHAITPEVRREIFSVGCRGEAALAAAAAPKAAAAAPVAAAAAAAAGAPRGGAKAAAGARGRSGDAMDEY